MEWISVKERLPKKEETVLTVIIGSDFIVQEEGETVQQAIERCRKEPVRVSMGFIGSDGWYGADGFPEIISPSYWMPLPEPPQPWCYVEELEDQQ